MAQKTREPHIYKLCKTARQITWQLGVFTCLHLKSSDILVEYTQSDISSYMGRYFLMHTLSTNFTAF